MFLVAKTSTLKAGPIFESHLQESTVFPPTRIFKITVANCYNAVANLEKFASVCREISSLPIYQYFPGSKPE